MALHTYTAFRWTGTQYNATYNTSYSAVIDDDDPAYQGAGDGDETASINGGAFGGTAGSPYVISINFTDPSGDPHIEDFYFFQTGGAWYFIPGPGSAFTVGSTLGNYQSHTVGWDYADAACFMRGTCIETDQGPIEVENLRAGMQVLSYDGGAKDLRLVLSRKIPADEIEVNDHLRPVRIMAGALGAGLPKRDLLVSRQHRMLVSSKIAQRMFGQSEVLVAAIKLCGLPGIFVDEQIEEVEYFHLIFEDHEVVFAESAPTESFFICEASLETLNEKARDELFAVLPDLEQPFYQTDAARIIPLGSKQKKLIARHVENRHDVLCQAG